MKITKSKLKRIIKEELLKEYAGGDSTEPQLGGTETGLPGSGWTSNPELDQVVDISNDVIENGGSLLDIAAPLKKQGFDAWLQMGVLVVDSGSHKYFIGKPEKFEIGPEDEVVEVGEFVVGLMG